LRQFHQRQADLGAIALDATGVIAFSKTSEVLAAYHNGSGLGDSMRLHKSAAREEGEIFYSLFPWRSPSPAP